MTDKLKKLPKDIQMMVEKGNLVSAIKTLASEENISMDDAKALIDGYEEQVKADRQKQQDNIAKKQAKKQTKQSQHSVNTDKNSFGNLNSSLDQHLAEQGYKKPLIPYWWKRVAVIVLVLALIVALIVYVVR